MGDQYKLYVDGNQTRLFDLSHDPAEMKDLSRELPEMTERMSTDLLAWKEEVMGELARVTREDDTQNQASEATATKAAPQL